MWDVLAKYQLAMTSFCPVSSCAADESTLRIEHLVWIRTYAASSREEEGVLSHQASTRSKLRSWLLSRDIDLRPIPCICCPIFYNSASRPPKFAVNAVP